MSPGNIALYIVRESDKFPDVYLRFISSNEYRQLLVVDDSDSLLGVIGEKEIENTLILAEKFKLYSADIMNTNFTYAIDGDDIREKCFEKFYNNDFDTIPIVSANDKHPIGLFRRSDFIEFRMISFAIYEEAEIVLNYVLLDMQNIFYIDIGAFDPWEGSITKWISISGRGRGINVEPLYACYKRLEADRPYDINIHSAVGDKEGKLKMYALGPFTTAICDYQQDDSEHITVSQTTLKKICDQHIDENQEIHFLKIDVEGFEKQVLLGADFEKYRPWIIMLEATKPGTEIPTYGEWEYTLVENRYIFAKQYGVNRFYVAEEHIDLLDRFIDIESIKKRLIIRQILHIERV